MTAPAHSPLPWRRIRNDRILDAEGNRIGAFCGTSVLLNGGNAAITVTAVSSHAELLAAAKEAVEILENMEGSGAHERAFTLTTLQAAIATAEKDAP